MASRTPVGVIGVGLMGEVYARRLVAAGFTVIGFDVDPAKSERLAQFGGHAGTLADIAQKCDPIVVAVFNTDQVEDVVERALIPAAASKIVLVTSTCDPDRIAALGAKVGDGGRAKLAVNLILGLNRLALAEGLVFAARLGLDPAAFLDVARRSAAASQVMDTKGPKMIGGDFAPEGRVRQTLKDTQLMLDQARKAGQQLPLLQIHADVLQACLRPGDSERDNSIVNEEIRRRVL